MPGNPLQQREISSPLLHTARLSFAGSIAALAVGGAALAAGLRWATLLIVFFVAATAVSRYRDALKIARAGGRIGKSGPRDPVQVLANGGAFAVAAVLLALTDNPMWGMFAAGALAAASSDTWATELGLLAARPPRSIAGGRRVPPGTSGGVTLAGTAAGAVGALVVAAAAAVLRTGVAPTAVFLGGVAGMLIDSVLGATVQERRWCPACDTATERRTHNCGTGTNRTGGLRGLDNDAVNALATLAGGAVAALLVASSLPAQNPPNQAPPQPNPPSGSPPPAGVTS